MTSPAAGVELWLIDLARAAPALAAIEDKLALLSDDERARAASLGAVGEDWRLIRVALRLLLERIAGPALRQAPFLSGPRGKPSLPGPAPIDFSLSHSGRYGLVAISGEAVGVDLELNRPVQFPADRQQAMLAAAQALAPSSQPIGILQAWVRLESWGKARGTGVGALLHDLGIRGPRWTIEATSYDFAKSATDLLRQERFKLCDLPLPAGLHGALAARSAGAEPAIRELPSDVGSLEALRTEASPSAAPRRAG